MWLRKVASLTWVSTAGGLGVGGLDPDSLAHGRGKGEGIGMQVVVSSRGLTCLLSLQKVGKTKWPEPASARCAHPS